MRRRLPLTHVFIVSALMVSGLSRNASGADDATKDCANAMSTFELNACAEQELSSADAALNAAYKKALAAVPKLASDKPYDAQSWEAALRGSQRAWVAFRDAECKDHVAMFWAGGTGGTAEILGCMSAMTKARTHDFVEQYTSQ